MSTKVTRLFKNFSPEHYDLHIRIAQDKKSFSGSVKVYGKKTGRPSRRITLHQKDLVIDSVEVSQTDKNMQESDMSISRIVTHKTYDELRIHTKDQMYAGKYTIGIDFHGSITGNLDGIYPCNFEDGNNKKQLIVTQFESHFARQAFPCIDEPEAKATFALTLTHNKNETALSNTPVKSQVFDDSVAHTAFEKTPLMSTYLLAFVIGELVSLESQSKSGIKIRTFAVADQIQNTEFALDVAVKAMDYYESYYDIPFPLPKCDFVALPDFAAGAMENWGLITFREQALLSDEHTSLSSKQYVAIVVAHELTHQWFGNLVTMRWWTDLWLNEGFASWMEYLAVDHLFPEWELWTQFAVDEQQTALKADALEHTHPIEVPVKHPDEIRSIFDVISYQKGASVIHMLHDYLGADDFRDGLRHYLKLHAYKNTDTIDLWQSLEDVAKKPVKKFMSAWTSLSGFPIVSVSQKNNYLELSQHRFVTNPLSESRKDTTVWPVPLLTSGLSTQTFDKKVQRIPFQTSTAPLMINKNQKGFYRTDYSHELQQKQLKAIEQGEISDIDRMSLLADGFEVTKAGYQSINEFIDLLAYFENEHTLPVWEIISNAVTTIRFILSSDDKDDELRNAMKPFIINLTKMQRQKLGWDKKDNETHLDTLLRPIIIGLSAGADEPQTLEKAKIAYSSRIDKNLAINPDTRSIAYATVARLGGEKEFNELLTIYRTTKSSDERLSVTSAMTSFKDAMLHERVLQLLQDGTVRMQDLSYWLVYSFMNRHSKDLTWEWVKNNWAWLKQNVGSDSTFGRMPVYAARSFCSSHKLEDYIKFFESRREPILERSYLQGLEIIQTQAAWRERDASLALTRFKALQEK